MSTRNEELYKEAEKAIKMLFEDTSVSEEECANNLRTLIDELNTMLELLGY